MFQALGLRELRGSGSRGQEPADMVEQRMVEKSALPPNLWDKKDLGSSPRPQFRV